MKKVSSLFFFLLLFSFARAQTQFVIQGNASSLGAGVFQITPNSTNKAGIITSMYAVDLATTFSLTFDMNFGSTDGNGADGMAFAISAECSPVLGTGQSLGTDNMNPSIVAKFDTYQNSSGVYDDLAADHTGLYKNGTLNAANRLNGAPVQMSAGAANVEDGSYHTVIINWTYTNATSQTISVTFDGSVRKTATGDYINGIFGGAANNLQFWSITGSTGSKYNDQRVRFSTINNQNQTSTCPDDSKTLIAPDRGSSYVWSPAPDAGQGTKTATVTPIATTTYTCSFNDYCSIPRKLAFTVTTPAEIKLSSTLTPAAICTGTTFTYNATSTSPAPSFAWTRAAVGGITEGASSGTGDISETLTNSTTSPISVTYVYTITSGTCVGASQNVVVSINPNATITLTSAAGTDNQNVCLNSAMTNITYAGNFVVSGGTDSGLPPGISGSNGAGVYTISGTPTVDGIYTYTVNTTGICVQTSTTGVLKVGFPLATANNIQSVCKNDPISDIVYNVAGGNNPLPTTDSGLPAGVSGSYNAGTHQYTISGAPTVEGIFNYTVTGQGSCGASQILFGKITSGGGLLPPGANIQTVCKGDPIVDIVYDIVGGNAPAVTFDGGLPAGVGGSFNAGTQRYTISGSPSVEGIFNYTLTAQGSCGSASFFYGTITSGGGLVTPGNNIQNVCKGNPIVDIVYDIAGGNTPVAVVDGGLPAGLSGSFNAGTQQYVISGSPSVEGIFNYTLTAQGSCGNASFFYGTITSGGGLLPGGGSNIQNICKNSAIIPIDYSIIGGGTPTVSGLTGSGLSGAISTAGDPGIFTISGTGILEGIYIYTVTTATTVTCGVQSSFTGTITIGGGLLPGGSNVQSICNNSTIIPIDYSIIGGGTPTVTGLAGSGLSGAISTAGDPAIFTISGTGILEGVYVYTVTTATTVACGVQSSFTGTITIGGGLLTTGGSNVQDICKNSAIVPIDYSIIGGGTPTVTGLAGSGLSGAITTAGDPGVFTISGTGILEGIYTYTVTTANGAGCGVQSAFTGTITIGGGLLPGGGSNVQNICKNSAIVPIDYSIIGGGTPTVTGLTGSGLSGAVSTPGDPGIFTISGIGTAEGIYVYTVTTATTVACSVQSTFTGTITIGGGLLTTGGSNVQDICKNSSIIPINYTIVGGGTPTVTGLTGSGLSGAISTAGDPAIFTISGTGTTEGIYIYTITTATTVACGVQSTFTGTITIGGGLLPGGGSNVQYICKNSSIIPIDYSIVGGGTPTVTGLTGSGLSGAISTAGDPGIFTISGVGMSEGIYVYTVTTATTVACGVKSSFTGTITIGGGLLPGGGSNVQDICKNSSIIPIDYSIVGGGTPTVTGLTGSGLSGAISTPGDPGIFTISGTGILEGIYVYTVTTATTVACGVQSSFTGTITIGGGLLPGGGSNVQDICKNSSIVPIQYNIVGGGTPVLTGLAGSGISGAITTAGDPAIYTISGTGLAEGIYVYTLTTATTVACGVQSSFTGTITIGGGLLPGGGSNVQDICKNSSIIPIKYSIIGGGTPVLTGLTGSGITGAITTAGDPSVYTISGTGLVEGIYVYTLTTATTVACGVKSSFTGTITIGGGLLPGGGSNVQDICKNSSIVPIKYSIVGGGTPVLTGLTGSGITGAITTAGDPAVYTISGTGLVEGIYVYTLTTATTVACGVPSVFTGTITIGGGLLTTGGSNVQGICKNSAIVPIDYRIIGGGTPTVTGLTGSGLSGVISIPGDPGVFTISGTGILEGIYIYTVTTATTVACGVKSSFTGTITVGGGLLPGGGSNIQKICKNTSIVPIDYSIIGGGTPTVTGLTGSGLSGAISTAGDPGVFTISGIGIAEGIYIYTVTTATTVACGVKSSFTGTITIGGGLLVPGDNVQTVCKNSPIKSIAYSIAGGNIPTAVIDGGLPPGVSGSYNSGAEQYIISGTPSLAGVFNYTVTAKGSCASASNFYGTITVDEATLTLISPAGTNSQAICLGDTIKSIKYQVGGTGISITVSTLPTGLSSSVGGGIITISGAPVVSDGTYTFTVSPTGGACPVVPLTFTITVMNPIASFFSDKETGKPPLTVNFTNTSQNADAYVWDFGDLNTSLATDTSNSYKNIGIYTVQLIATNNLQCPDTATSTITVYKFIASNVFTPNGDNINDVFIINSTGIANLSAQIFNRWGTKMYEWDATSGGWDGINFINGIPCNNGTYYYIIKAKDIDGEEYNETGYITLLR